MPVPLIAVTIDRSVQDSAFGPRDSVLQVLEYAEAVVTAGGRPALLPATEEIPDDLLEGFDGLILTGGGDLSPEIYGEAPDERAYGISPLRDRFESALVADAVDRRLPILVICRGLQLVNVLRGGSLVQHLDGHWQTVPSNRPDHDVDVEPGSMLAGVVGAGRLPVNSYHHQAVDRLGEGLTVTAGSTGADGVVIEAFEDPVHDLLAVQWHPEHLFRDVPEQLALFHDLVQRARATHERNPAHV